MKNQTRFLPLGAALAAISLTQPALADGGVFDKLDPCIEQTDQFRASRISYLTELNQSVADADKAVVTSEYREAWMKAKRVSASSDFRHPCWANTQDAGVKDIEAAYSGWFDRQLEAIGAENVDKIVSVNFHEELKQLRIEQRKLGEADIQSGKNELDKACKMDAGNQMLRGVLTTALAPIGMVSRNLEIAKRESGFGAKILAGATGISVDAINQNGGVFGGGLSGGENSVFRKNLGIRF